MKEPRAVRYGKARGYEILSKVDMMPESIKRDYILKLIKAIKSLRYDILPRPKGLPDGNFLLMQKAGFPMITLPLSK